ncbi:putative methyltransferase-domain-containing protein [Annulohypoxylon maeteangense]|uniref:putative methyltransferase-domain-containing protein n=1 Tax=Annulohypoxylon maeteangense TaxID=1927788 RepID=UPI002007B523|nr:putative methyltransferase-domain-containing protein [Annulohypoxylon maeteangense]KAI0879928.1 putative methyltransferase-domain-containing protein [Annulohypoxylon maeteangense]
MAQEQVNTKNQIIYRFCRQYLQLERDLDYPSPTLLREADVQNSLYNQIFRDGALNYYPPPRYQLRVLKELMSKIEASIEDWDSHGISDDLMSSLSNLLALPLPSEITAAQQKSYVTYSPSLLNVSTSHHGSLPAQVTLLESRNLISAFGTTGLRTWEAALHLGQFLSTNPSIIHNKTVLELGAGTGYLSILCAKFMAPTMVIASDGSDDVVANLPENFFLNGLQESEMIRAMDVKWGHALVGTEDEHWNGGRPIDVVLAADVTYDKGIIPALIGTLEELVGMFPHVAIYIAATERNRETFEVFLNACEERYLNIDEIYYELPRRKDQYGPFYSDQVPIRICRILNCQAVVKFTTDRWEVDDEMGLVLTWADAIGVVNIDFTNVATEGPTRPNNIAKDYTGNNTFVWRPNVDLAPGDYVFHIKDEWSKDESPRLTLSAFFARSPYNNMPRDRDTSKSNGSDGSGDDGIGPSTAAGIGVGSTLGGILLLALVAFLVYRGRQNKTRLEDQETNERIEGKQKQKEPRLEIYES